MMVDSRYRRIKSQSILVSLTQLQKHTSEHKSTMWLYLSISQWYNLVGTIPVSTHSWLVQSRLVHTPGWYNPG